MKQKAASISKQGDRQRALRRKEAKERSYHTGVSDGCSVLLGERLQRLGLTQRTFAAMTDSVAIGSDVSSRRSTRTRESLVSSFLKGKKSLPLGRVLTWTAPLKVQTDVGRQRFVELIVLANAMRDARRLVTGRNQTKDKLVALIGRSLATALEAWEWELDIPRWRRKAEKLPSLGQPPDERRRGRRE